MSHSCQYSQHTFSDVSQTPMLSYIHSHIDDHIVSLYRGPWLLVELQTGQLHGQLAVLTKVV